MGTETTEDDLEEIELNKITWHIRPYYKNVVFIGGGAFGNVCKAEDESCIEPSNGPRQIAIKKLHRPFHSGEHARRVFREIRLMRYLEHDNVIEMVDAYTPEKDYRTIENVYLVTEHAGWDLAKLICAAGLKYEQIVLIVYQLLRGLKYLHSGNIVHRILDFGLARKVTWEIMTEYVVTRYYRAPEILCWSGKYNQKADMWSVGCILAELLTGEVLFNGCTGQHQFSLIIKVCGSPSEELLDKIEAVTSKTTRNMIESLGHFERQDFTDVFKGVTPSASAIDFLDKVLVLDPDKRMSVDDALKHPFVEKYHVPEDEPVMENCIDLEDDRLGRDDIEGWKDLIWVEIQKCQEHLRNKAELVAASE